MKKYFVILTVLTLLVGKVYSQQLNLDTVIERSAKAVEEILPQGAKVAVLNFVSTSESFSDYVIEEITGKLVNGRKVTIVDRRNMALISQEMNFQLSGDVSDESAQAIGRMLGAQSIVSGTLTNMGTFYRFRIRVISVETAAIQTQSSFDLRNDEQVAFLLRGNSSSNVVTNPSTVVQQATLNGVWERVNDGRRITVSGNTGVWTTFGFPLAPYDQDAINKGWFKIGEPKWRNLTNTGNLTWSGLDLSIEINQHTNVALRILWNNATFTLSMDGNTLQTIHGTYTRQQ
jgi:TolB-like protein